MTRDERAQLRAQLEEIRERIQDTNSARMCLFNNGCYAAVVDANDLLQRLFAEEEAIRNELQPEKKS